MTDLPLCYQTLLFCHLSFVTIASAWEPVEQPCWAKLFAEEENDG